MSEFFFDFFFCVEFVDFSHLHCQLTSIHFIYKYFFDFFVCVEFVEFLPPHPYTLNLTHMDFSHFFVCVEFFEFSAPPHPTPHTHTRLIPIS